MTGISRPLFDFKQIHPFLIETLQMDTFLMGEGLSAEDIKVRISEYEMIIKEANTDLYKVLKYNTYDCKKYRINFKTDRQREELRNNIKKQLIQFIRPDDDDDISYNVGGMLPKSGYVSENREVYIVIGLPASGKSHIAALISDATNSKLIDSDFVKRKFPEFVKVNGASLVHKESKMIASEIRQEAIDKGENIVIPIIGDDFNELVELIKAFKTRRYKPFVILVELDRIKAAQRALLRFAKTKRYIPLNNIVDGYAQNPALTYYKLREFYPKERCMLIDTDVDFAIRYKKVSYHNCKELYEMI